MTVVLNRRDGRANLGRGNSELTSLGEQFWSVSQMPNGSAGSNPDRPTYKQLTGRWRFVTVTKCRETRLKETNH